MHRCRLATAARALLTAAALSAPALGTFAAPAGAALTSATDKAGDTVTDVVEDAITTPAADIIAVSVDAQPESIVLGVRTTMLADPLQDRNWMSDFTNLVWKLDTNGDAKRDYTIEYYVDQETKQITADLLRNGGGGQPPADCQPQAGFDPVAGYTITVAPRCLSGAPTFTYQVSSEYTVDATDDGADVGTDISPDQEWSAPVTVTLAAGVTPVTLSAPKSTPVEARQPQPSPDGPAATTPTTAARSTTAPTTAAKPPGTPSRPRPGAGTSSSPSGAASGAAAPDLAHTGPSRNVARAAGMAVGIILIGIGMQIANRRPKTA